MLLKWGNDSKFYKILNLLIIVRSSNWDDPNYRIYFTQWLTNILGLDALGHNTVLNLSIRFNEAVHLRISARYNDQAELNK